MTFSPLRVLLWSQKRCGGPQNNKNTDAFDSSVWPSAPGKLGRGFAHGRCDIIYGGSAPEAIALEPFPGGVVYANGREILFREPLSASKAMPDAPCVLWDEQGDTLTCFAHPLGRGTFFFAQARDFLAISTSLVDIAILFGITGLDEIKVAEYLASLNRFGFDQTRSFLKGVKQLPPGHRLSWQNGRLMISRYWQPEVDDEFESLSSGKATEKLRSALVHSLGLNLPMEIAGCLSSGGLDSSLVAALVHEQQRANRKTTVLVTLGHGIDCAEERRYQNHLANHLGIAIFTPTRLDPQLQLSAVRALNRFADAPSGGLFTGVYAQLIQEASEEGIGGLFGGEGGDEIFASGPEIVGDFLLRHLWQNVIRCGAFLRSQDLEETFLRIILRDGILPSGISSNIPRIRQLSLRLCSILGVPWDSRNGISWRRMIGPFADRLDSALEAFAHSLRYERHAGTSLSLYATCRRALEIPFYEPAWPFSTAPPLSTFSPLSDIKIFESAMSLRLEERMGTWIGFQSKVLLRELARQYLPEILFSNPKIGRPDLLARMTSNVRLEVQNLFTSKYFQELALQVPDDLRDPTTLPRNFGLCWIMLLVLAVWAEELVSVVEESRIRYPLRPIHQVLS